MAYKIALSDDAEDDLRKLDARWKAAVREAMEIYLRHAPAKISKSRIKRLRDTDHPQYRLRVGDLRVFYDVEDDYVKILGIITKPQAAGWLADYQHKDL